MAWIESHTVLIRHRKLIELARQLSAQPVHILGHIHALWHTVLEQQEDGDLSKWSDEFIAQAAHWSGDAVMFVTKLRECGFLDETRLHDWLDYAGRYLSAKYRVTNPLKLKHILAQYKKTLSPKSRRSKDGLKTGLDGLKTDNLPNLPNLPYICVDILNFLNDQTGRTYEPTKINLSFISQRIEEGATPDKCRQVIIMKTKEWLNDPKMYKYLRPATLFNKTKFSLYLEELNIKQPIEKTDHQKELDRGLVL